MIKKWLSLGVAMLALCILGVGIKSILNSPLFLIQIVEVAPLPQNPPVDAETLSELASIPIGKISLFRLKLKEVEDRLLKHAWIKEVKLEKHFPQTLRVSVVFKVPLALFQNSSGSLSYIDAQGKIYGKLNLATLPDLPLFSGFPHEQPRNIKEALALLQKWDQSELNQITQITSVSYDAERGYQALVTYPLLKSKISSHKSRTFVHLGTDFNSEEFIHQLSRLKQVFSYLTSRGIGSQQIWADTGKKVIVKTTPGS